MQPVQHCPAECPVCGANLKRQGYPIKHQHDDTGEECTFEWDVEAATEQQIADETAEQLAALDKAAQDAWAVKYPPGTPQYTQYAHDLHAALNRWVLDGR